MADNFRQGAQDPGSNTTQYNSLIFTIQREIAKTYVGMPVRVVTAPYTMSQDGTKTPITPGTAGPIGFIDVLPMVNQIDGQGNPTQHETVQQITYHRYQSGSGAFISDPVVGDIGHMVVPNHDTSVVLATSDLANPGSYRKNDMADGVYLGTIRSGNPAQSFAWTSDGFHIQDKNGNTIIGNAAGITINGWLFPRGKTDNINTHVHTGVTAGAADTGPPA